MRVGITQRVECVTGYLETRDCLDQKWSELLDVLNMTIVPIPNTLNNIEGWLEDMSCDAYILTGGNDLADLPDAQNASKQRDKTEIALLKHAQACALPVLGVCRGFQLINIFMGGKLDKVSGHVATRHLVRLCFDQDEQSASKIVNSFHEWGISISSLATQLIPCAFDNDNYVESARHEELNWLGIMWHPEREENPQQFDIELISKLFDRKYV
jgi:N5-(cytidine 5'-diphosphoramidyl)-L-glutamine hydrolase